MEVKKKERRVTRAMFAKLANELELNLNAGKELDLLKIKTQWLLLDKKVVVLHKLDEKINHLMCADENTSDQELIEEHETVDSYTQKFLGLKLRYENISSKVNSATDSDLNSHCPSSPTLRRRFQLPVLQLTKFSGDVKGWIPFWTQFSKIDEDDSIDPRDKVEYLLQATVEGSVARQLVSSFPLTAANYHKILDCLKSRYGREDLLIEVYIRELLKLIISNTLSKCRIDISDLYDQLETQIRALETLGVTTDKCAAILYPLIESCLPEDLIRVWQRSSYATGPNSGTCSLKDRLDNLLSFLRAEIEGEQKINLALEGFGLKEETSTARTSKKRASGSTNENLPTAAGLFTATKDVPGCIFCRGRHKSFNCFRAKKMNVEEKKRLLDLGHVCYLCLKQGHHVKTCRSRLTCPICDSKHHVLICDAKEKHAVTATTVAIPEPVSISTLANFTKMVNVCLQTLLVTIFNGNSKRIARALIDTGSQRSYVLRSTALELRLPAVRAEILRHTVFGGSTTNQKAHQVYLIKLGDVSQKFMCSFEALEQDAICGPLPSVVDGPWVQDLAQQHIELHDSNAPIELLIGADMAGQLLDQRVHKLTSGLVAVGTKLGWTLMGSPQGYQKETAAFQTTSMLVQQAKITDLWTLDVLGIQDPTAAKTNSELHEAALAHFHQTVTINKNSRYEVHLPWVEGHPALQSNYEVAFKRLGSLVSRLKRNNLYGGYDSVLQDWLTQGIIEEVPSEEKVISGASSYLPHRAVVKENSTTRIRPVFDASAKGKGPSLNDCLEKGVNLIECIPSILNRFRQRAIGVTADIKAAFLQISITTADRDFLRFLWIDPQGELRVFRHCRVVFGITSSPFLLGAVLNYHLKNVLELCDQGKSQYAHEVVSLLKDSFYVDNCVTSVKDERGLQQFVHQATAVMAEGNFELRGWEHSGQLSEGCQPARTNVLGLLWFKGVDEFGINLDSIREMKFEKVTKRVILSAAHRLFDPIGVTCCVTLLPKILLQRLWQCKIGWEEEVDEYSTSEFRKWLEEVSNLDMLRIPRLLVTGTAEETWTLHVFCDASQSAYAAAIFLRSVHLDDINVQLLQARSRVSPVEKNKKKTMTIPRLELLAATIGSRLYVSIIKDFPALEGRVTFWTDSSTVLAWITRKERWDVFVSNRIKEIRHLTNVNSWRHVPGVLNPADLPSRGCSATKLLQSRWWEGPEWLRQPEHDWPLSSCRFDEKEIQSEQVKSVASHVAHSEDDWYYRYFSRFEKIVRMVGWILRFKNNSSVSLNHRVRGELSVSEIQRAEKKVLFLVQQRFSGLQDPRLATLRPFMGSDGLIRLRTQVSNREDIEDFCHPVVLPPSEHPVVYRLIHDLHKSANHAGLQTTMSLLRRQYWILGGRRTIRKVLQRCVTCKRFLAKKVEVVPPPLPEPRVRDARIFEIVGVDFAGPLFLKGSPEKSWICLFTCAVYRAVHFELVSSLSTDKFLLCFRKFVARRGRPSVVYSDNGSNFVGTVNALNRIDWDKVKNGSSAQKVEWRLIPPSAPWWGGWWERLVGLLKQLLRRVLGRASLDFEEMESVLQDCEATINSRPLTYLSEDPHELIPLSPDLFLRDVQEVGNPDLDHLEECDLHKRLRYRNKVRSDLRRRFRNEYLGQLKLLAGKRKGSLRKGDIVLLGDEVAKRLDWPLAVIEEVIPGRDGEVRLAKVRTAKGSLLRAAQRLYPLELDHPIDSNQQSVREKLREETTKPSKTKTTRRGRPINPPKILDM